MIRRGETSSHGASNLNCSLGNGVLTGAITKGGLFTKGSEDYLEDKLVSDNPFLIWQKKRQPAAHREGAFFARPS